MTILELLQSANDRLKQREIVLENQSKKSTMLDAEVILSYVLGIPKSKLFARLGDPVGNQEKNNFDAAVERRLKSEPVAYIVGEKEFYSRPFFVNPSVLIPRPATETLVDEAKALVCAKQKDQTLFADIGTGSGAIAITLAAETGIPVVACDINPDAISIAKKNAQRHGVSDLIDFQQGHVLDPLRKLFKKLASTNTHFKHLIICANLPYLTNFQLENAQIELHFEPQEALKAGTDGLDLYFELFKDLSKHRFLFPTHTSVLIEIDPAQTEPVKKLIGHDFLNTEMEIKKDLDGFNRVLITSL